MLATLMLMPQRKKRPKAMSLPAELHTAFDEVAAELGAKDKWMASVAAVLLLVDADDGIRNYLFSRAADADLPGRSFADLVAAAKSGKLARDAAAHAGKRLRIAAKRPQPPRAPS